MSGSPFDACLASLRQCCEAGYAVTDTLTSELCACVPALAAREVGVTEFQAALDYITSALAPPVPPAVWTQWLAALSTLCQTITSLPCTQVETVAWAWEAVLRVCAQVFGEYAARTAAAGVDDSTTSPAGVGMEDIAAASKQGVATLGSAVLMLAPVMEPAHAAPDVAAFVSQAAAHLLSLNAFVSCNFALMNSVWKSLTALLAQRGDAIPADGPFRFEDAMGALLDHMDASLACLCADGAPCGDAKVAGRHIKVMRFCCGHLAAFFKHDHLLPRVAGQWIRAVLLFVRLRQIAFAPLPGGPHAIQTAMLQFLVPPTTVCALR